MATRLPSPRQLLTGLISSLPQQASSEASSFSSPLKSLSVSDRAILTTLHVLFPSLLLQALDLLDRSLVTRVVLGVATSHPLPASLLILVPEAEAEAEANHELGAPHAAVVPPQAPIHLSAPPALSRIGGPAASEREKETAAFYLVRSAQFVHQHRRTSGSAARCGSSERNYTVRLTAWNCTCPSFAFSAFPAAASVAAERFRLGGHGNSKGAGEGYFGGLSLDGAGRREDGDGDEGVPCCKHLLACLLAERWRIVLGGFVNERRVGREEMAGLGAEG